MYNGGLIQLCRKTIVVVENKSVSSCLTRSPSLGLVYVDWKIYLMNSYLDHFLHVLEIIRKISFEFIYVFKYLTVWFKVSTVKRGLGKWLSYISVRVIQTLSLVLFLYCLIRFWKICVVISWSLLVLLELSLSPFSSNFLNVMVYNSEWHFE